MGSDPADLARSDLVEGELVAGHDGSAGSVLQHGHGGGGRPEIKRRRLEFRGIVADGGALPSPTPSCERDSDGTISDTNGVASLAQERLLFPCPVCGARFRNQKAVCGHMRVHDLHGRQQGDKERPPATLATSGGWALTGKRGSVGGRSASPESEGVVDSVAVVVPEPVIDPVPIAFASGRSSAVPGPPPEGESMAIVVASPTSQVVLHPPCSPQFLQGHQPAGPQPTVAQAQPTVAQGQQLAESEAPPFVAHQRAAPQAVAPHVQRASPPPPARDEQGWWLCKEKGCGQRYATHQGLGGHMAGHKNRQNNEAAAMGLHLGAKPAKLHPCKHCPQVFTSGMKLGGHMRKHYQGKITPTRGGARPKVSARVLASALSPSLQPRAPSAMEVAPAQPAVAPASAPVEPGVLRIFGVDIVAKPPAEAAKESSSAVTETDQSSPASTNIEQ